MKYNDIIYEKEDNGICTITLNRPNRKNSLTPVTFIEIEQVLDDMEADKNAKVLILTGCEEANAFSSGGSFVSFASTPSELKNKIDPADMAQKRLALRFWEFYKPVITVINGLAVGAGITMPLIASDLIYMSEDAWLGYYFIKRCIVAEFASNFLLPFYVGFQKAKEIVYFGDKISALEAEKLRLVNKVLPKEKVLPYAREQALKLIPPKGPGLAIKLIKKTMHSYFSPILKKILDLENQSIAKAIKTRDFRESAMALKAKREPKFRGK
ncbi:MAG: enoyl-CoA hydratase [Candidatus Lokiarchaeota archaeon]|nr:enoyl-CoA hydratase [Candidatus Lokiarchaeota archaeon]MBD3339042.1 enoyl-CoA hydratase [Candidatus Lokiarchaeota archaeon]